MTLITVSDSEVVMLKGRMESLIKAVWKGLKILFKYIYYALKWFLLDLIPLYLLFSKIFPNAFPERKPGTIVVWIFVIYIGCFGFAAGRYLWMVEKAETAYNNFTSQISTGVPFDVDRLRKIGDTKLPVKPELTWPWEAGEMLDSLLYSSENYQTYAVNEGFEKTEDFIRKDIFFWKHKLNNANLFGIDLSGEDLHGINFSGANLSGVNLSGANLVKSDLSGALLQGTNLSGADLSGADLAGTDLTGTQLAKADLSKANLSNADLFGIDLSGGILPGADLAGANLAGINLAGALLEGADMSGTNLSTADLPQADLSSANLARANLFGVDLTKAKLYGADLYESNLKRANLTDTNLSMANFTSAKLADANLNRAYLSGTVFLETDFSDARKITSEQLIRAKTLYMVKQLDETVEEEIRSAGFDELIDNDPNEPEIFEEVEIDDVVTTEVIE